MQNGELDLDDACNAVWRIATDYDSVPFSTIFTILRTGTEWRGINSDFIAAAITELIQTNRMRVSDCGCAFSVIRET